MIHSDLDKGWMDVYSINSSLYAIKTKETFRRNNMPNLVMYFDCLRRTPACSPFFNQFSFFMIYSSAT